MVFDFTLVSLFISCLTNAKSAMSIANAMRVISAARKERIDASNVMVMCVDMEQMRATKVTAAADGGITD